MALCVTGPRTLGGEGIELLLGTVDGGGIVSSGGQSMGAMLGAIADHF